MDSIPSECEALGLVVFSNIINFIIYLLVYLFIHYYLLHNFNRILYYF